jgi:hypothetical protein
LVLFNFWGFCLEYSLQVIFQVHYH